MSILNLQLNRSKKIERYIHTWTAGNTIEVLWFHNFIMHSAIGLQLLTTDTSSLPPSLVLILGLIAQQIALFSSIMHYNSSCADQLVYNVITAGSTMHARLAVHVRSNQLWYALQLEAVLYLLIRPLEVMHCAYILWCCLIKYIIYIYYRQPQGTTQRIAGQQLPSIAREARIQPLIIFCV